MTRLFSFHGLRKLSLTLGGCLALAACAAPQSASDHRATPEAATAKREKPLVTSDTAMIAVANPLAAQAGYKILRAGGSAVDAAIAAQMVLNLVEPQSSGIGGGGFLLVYDPKTKSVTSFDGRETAPKAVDENLFIKEDGSKMGFFEAVVGGRGVGTPGLVHMLDQAHQRYGRIGWPVLFDDAIALSEKGFAVSERLHSLVAKDKYLKDDPTARDFFYDEQGQALPVGHILKNPEFAQTLRQIQAGRAASFYLGQIADDIVHKVRNHPTNAGVLSVADMQSYQSVQRAPVCMPYNGYKVCGMAPPSSGGLTVLQILGIMDAYRSNRAAPIDETHLFIEAQKLAFADRNHYMADSDFVPVPEGLLDPDYLKSRQALIRANAALPAPQPAGHPLGIQANYAPDTTSFGLSTTHMSVIDQNGMVVSMTTSIENAFGSRQMVGGFLLNNQLTDFSFVPEKDGRLIANRVEAGKRPRSSMAPTLVLDEATNTPVLAIGSPGGSRIIGYVAQSLLAILDHDMPINSALALGHITNRNGAVDLEIDTEAVAHKALLERLGHQKINVRAMTSGLHGIRRHEDGSLSGSADPRREGVALGY